MGTVGTTPASILPQKVQPSLFSYPDLTRSIQPVEVEMSRSLVSGVSMVGIVLHETSTPRGHYFIDCISENFIAFVAD